MITISDIFKKLLEKNPNSTKDAREMIERAYIYAAKVHSAQIRLSGEPYLSHPLNVANILLDYTTDESCITGGLLHDIFEDTEVKPNDVPPLFGDDIGNLLINFHKFVQFDSKIFRDNKVETFFVDFLIDSNIEFESKLLKEDSRILLIRLADCIHNAQTLSYIKNQSKRDWFLHTSINFRVPLAKKLGFVNIANDLELICNNQISNKEIDSPLIFLCYAREDKNIVDDIYKQLMNLGFRPWMDKPPEPFDMMGLKPGENWQFVINHMITKCDYFFAFLSKNSISKKGYVQKEYRSALKMMNELPVNQIKLIPILVEECDIPDIEVDDVSIKNFQWFELYQNSIEKLSSMILRDYKINAKSC